MICQWAHLNDENNVLKVENCSNNNSIFNFLLDLKTTKMETQNIKIAKTTTSNWRTKQNMLHNVGDKVEV